MSPDSSESLKPKEGVVLDQEGNVLHDPLQARRSDPRFSSRVFVYRGGGLPFTLGLILLTPVLLLMGVVTLAVVLVFVILFTLVRPFVRR